MKFALLEKQKSPAIFKKVAITKKQQESSLTRDFGLLVLRLATGGLLSGHGSQKIFGWFNGPGLKGTAAWLESMGMQPGTPWAAAASASEFGGGMLTTLGFLSPLGPIATMGSMVMAAGKVHWGKPIWVTQGGAELPVTNMATALALTIMGPGRFSLDRLFGIRLPRALVISLAAAEAIMVTIGILSRPKPQPALDTAMPVEEDVVAGTL
ncbi:MAG TPA: DoxX family protein [Ktedonobacteraceae bacterium]|nr:DoxX family protein [Ktedonobacteraceae bacterium]